VGYLRNQPGLLHALHKICCTILRIAWRLYHKSLHSSSLKTFSLPPIPHIAAAVTTARLPFKSITVVVAWSCCYKRRRRSCDSDTSTQNRHCEMLQCRKCTHPWTQDRNQSEKQNSGKKPKQEAKKLLNNKIHPLPYQKKQKSRKPRKFRLALHSQLQKETLWSWKNRMKSSKVCNFLFKGLESCFASKRDKERQSSPWHHSRRESLSIKNKTKKKKKKKNKKKKKKNHPNLCKAPMFLRSKNQNPQGEFGNAPIFTNPKKKERGSNWKNTIIWFHIITEWCPSFKRRIASL